LGGDGDDRRRQGRRADWLGWARFLSFEQADDEFFEVGLEFFAEIGGATVLVDTAQGVPSGGVKE